MFVVLLDLLGKRQAFGMSSGLYAFSVNHDAKIQHRKGVALGFLWFRWGNLGIICFGWVSVGFVGFRWVSAFIIYNIYYICVQIERCF